MSLSFKVTMRTYKHQQATALLSPPPPQRTRVPSSSQAHAATQDCITGGEGEKRRNKKVHRTANSL